MGGRQSTEKNKPHIRKASWRIVLVAVWVAALLTLMAGCTSQRAESQSHVQKYDLPGRGFALFSDSRGWLWVGTSQGVTVIEPGGVWRVIQLIGSDGQALGVRVIAEDRLKTVWLGTTDGVLRLDPVSGKVEERLLGGQVVTALAQGSEETLWIGAISGLYEYRGAGVLVSMDLLKAGIPDTGVTALALDSTGRLWIGTWGGLASYIPGKGLRRHAFESAKLVALPVYALLVDSQDQLWVGTIGGLARSAGPESWREQFMDKGAQFGEVEALALDRAGRLWVGTLSDGLRVLDANGKELKIVSGVKRSGPVTALAMDRKGKIWAAMSGELASIDPQAVLSQPDRATSVRWDDIIPILLLVAFFAVVWIWWARRPIIRILRLPEPSGSKKPVTQPMPATLITTARTESIDTLLAVFRTGTPAERRRAVEELEKRGQVEVF